MQSPYGAFCLRPYFLFKPLPVEVELQSPYGAFCLRPTSFMSAAPAAIARCCNPLTGLFVCDPLLCGSTEAACIGGCNPLTGLFVCDRPEEFTKPFPRFLRLQSPYGAFCLRPTSGAQCSTLGRRLVAIPLRGFLFATLAALFEPLPPDDEVAIPLRGFLFATRCVSCTSSGRP